MDVTIAFASNTPASKEGPNLAGKHWHNVWRRLAQNQDRYVWRGLRHDGTIRVLPPGHETEADYIVVVNRLGGGLPYPEEKTVLIQLEPAVVRHAKGGNWGKWEDYAWTSRLAGAAMIGERSVAIDWNIAKTWGALRAATVPPYKTSQCSCCQTWKHYHPGHQYRSQLVYGHLANNTHIDYYGNMVRPGTTAKPPVWAWHGALPMRQKDKALQSYMYHICVENSSEYNYWTEKIADALLYWCLPLYWGCPNLHTFLPEGSYIRLPDDPEHAADVIQRVIESKDVYYERISAIAEARKRILERWQVFGVLEDILLGE